MEDKLVAYGLNTFSYGFGRYLSGERGDGDTQTSEPRKVWNKSNFEDWMREELTAKQFIVG